MVQKPAPKHMWKSKLLKAQVFHTMLVDPGDVLKKSIWKKPVVIENSFIHRPKMIWGLKNQGED